MITEKEAIDSKLSWGDIAKQYFPDYDDKALHVVLMCWTCYPFGSFAQIIEDLEEAKVGVAELGYDGYYDKIVADMDAELAKIREAQKAEKVAET